eukprot:TRINITY_DN16362_c0_g1_i1.p1 TRINITY_DN16362_c0_g1~~TRINITY_DN16362_c0_g1_i1.p1  ORF type:complete len:444 (+),score=58.65 TRINITY_DN16362_c0_g1_i1:39-1370(+)
MRGSARALWSWLSDKNTKLFFSIAFSFTCVGMAISALGPCMLEIARRTGTTAGEAGLLVTVRGGAYATGSALGGPLFDKYDANRILAISVSLAGLATFCIPFVWNIWALGFLVFFQGAAMGMLDTGGNVITLWIFSDKNPEPYLQAIHFMFAIGALLSPLVVGVIMDNFHDNFNIAYWLLASLFTPVVISLALQDSPKIRKSSDPSEAPLTTSEFILGKFTKDERIVITLSGLFLGIYVGAEVSLGTLIYTYSVRRGLSEQTGYLLTSVFWVLIAAGRLLAVPLSTKLPPHRMLLINIIGCVVGTLLLLVFDPVIYGNNVSHLGMAVWIAVPVYGLFMASCFPTVFTLAEQLITVSGKAASFFVLGSSLGEMAIPAIVASLFETPVGYFSLPATVFIAAVMKGIVWMGFRVQAWSMHRRGAVPFKKLKEEIDHDPTEETPLSK